MPDIKTKNVVKGTVKTIHKSAVAAERMKDAYIRTKDKAEHGVYSAEGSAEEYAADRISGCADTVTREAVRQFDKQGRRGVQSTKNNISKAKEHFRQQQAQKSIKTLERGEKTIKQTAKSTGKSTIKTAKGSVKTAQKTVKTAEQTARTAIKTSERAAKVAQKTAQASAKAARTAAQAAKATAKATVATIKGGSQSHGCGGQGDYSRNKGLDFRYRRRRLGCRCDYHCGMPDCLDCRLVFRYLFFGRGFGKQYDNAKRGTGNQHRLPNAA